MRVAAASLLWTVSCGTALQLNGNAIRRPQLTSVSRAGISVAAMSLPLESKTMKNEHAEYSDDTCVIDECVGDRTLAGVSYRAQFEELFSMPLATNQPVPKPSNEAQQRESSAVKVPFSNVFGTLMRKPSERAWSSTDWGRASWFVMCHTVGVLAWTRYFSWRMLGIHFLLYCACGMGITYSFHRQLAHRAFKSPKWLEYCASCANAPPPPAIAQCTRHELRIAAMAPAVRTYTLIARPRRALVVAVALAAAASRRRARRRLLTRRPPRPPSRSSQIAPEIAPEIAPRRLRHACDPGLGDRLGE